MLNFLDLGYAPYEKTWNMQKEMQKKRINNQVEDTIFLVEHEPVYTFGKNSDENHLLQNYPHEVKVYQTERGGDITYHGPGQLVGYPIIDLHNYKMSISWYMRSLEFILINTLSQFGIIADRKEGLTGVWVKDKKIAALGVRISRWVTMHGFALNVNTDLHFFDSIIPCGIFEYGVTTMKKQLGKEIKMERVKETLKQQCKFVFKKDLRMVN